MGLDPLQRKLQTHLLDLGELRLAEAARRGPEHDDRDGPAEAVEAVDLAVAAALRLEVIDSPGRRGRPRANTQDGVCVQTSRPQSMIRPVSSSRGHSKHAGCSQSRPCDGAAAPMSTHSPTQVSGSRTIGSAPEPSPDPSPEPSPDPSPDPSPEPSPDPSPEPSPDPSPDPSPEPSPDPSPEPSGITSAGGSRPTSARASGSEPPASPVVVPASPPRFGDDLVGPVEVVVDGARERPRRERDAEAHEERRNPEGGRLFGGERLHGTFKDGGSTVRRASASRHETQASGAQCVANSAT